MGDTKDDPIGAALLEFTCRFLTVMLDSKAIGVDAAQEMLFAVERALITGKQWPESIIALSAAMDGLPSRDIG